MSQTKDPIEELDEILDEDEELEGSYIGKTFLYRCIDCGVEKYVKGGELDDVTCDECGGDTQIVEEGIYDKQQDIHEKSSGKTELEELQDEVGENADLKKTDDVVGNITDVSEEDEILDSVELELEDDEDIESGYASEEELLLEVSEEETLESFRDLIPDDEDENY